MCVKNVRCGFSASTIFSDASTVECVGCGLYRKSIQKQDVESMQLGERTLGHLAEVSQIRSGTEAVAIDLCLTVNHRHRSKTSTANLYWTVDLVNSTCANPPNL